MNRDTYYDYIRALAALLVLFGHKGKFPSGAIGVSIFFCLSGFLITKILIELPALTFFNLVKFTFRRWMRIFPLYVATIAITYLLMRSFRPESLSRYTDAIIPMITFTSLPSPWTGFAAAVGWTLHAEFWFYVTFPVVFYFTFNRGLLPYVIGLLILGSVLAKVFAGHDSVWPIRSDAWLTVVYLDQLMFGAACAMLIASRSSVVEAFHSRW